MLKFVFFLSFFLSLSATAQEYDYLFEHYSKSGAIPQKEIQKLIIKNVYLASKEQAAAQHRSIASKIQHDHIIKIVNKPLEIRLQ